MSLRQGPTKKFWGGRGWAWHSECLGHLGRVKSVGYIRTSESGGHRGRDSKMHNFVGKTYICLLILSFLHFLEGRGEKVPVPPPPFLYAPICGVCWLILSNNIKKIIFKTLFIMLLFSSTEIKLESDCMTNNYSCWKGFPYSLMKISL